MRFFIVYFISIIATLCSCQNRTENAIESMSEYSTTDSVLICKVPSFLSLTQAEDHSLQFAGGNKMAKVMIIPVANRVVKDDLVQQMVGDFRTKMTLVEDNDSISAYEIQRGMTTIPAQMVSVYNRNGYAVILATMGIDLKVHKAMGQSIRCKEKGHEDIDSEFSKYQGKYLSIEYPSEWIVDEHPNTQTADVWIMQKDHAFGVWLFRFEKEDNNSFEDAMTNIANNWREVAKVEMAYKQINDVKWCKHDIRMSMQGQVGRQISYYCQKGGYIYNVKFGNSSQAVEMNQATIELIMASVIFI